MPSTSQSQQQAAGIAHAVKKGEIPESKLRGASKQMAEMSGEDLKDFAKTKRKNLPMKKSAAFLQGYTAKEGGYWSETFGSMLNPLNLYGGIQGGGIAALATPTKSLEEQAEQADIQAESPIKTILQNLLIPGVGPYRGFKRLGTSIRGPELKKMQAEKKEKREGEEAKEKKEKDKESEDNNIKESTMKKSAAVQGYLDGYMNKLAGPGEMAGNALSATGELPSQLTPFPGKGGGLNDWLRNLSRVISPNIAAPAAGAAGGAALGGLVGKKTALAGAAAGGLAGAAMSPAGQEILGRIRSALSSKTAVPA